MASASVKSAGHLLVRKDGVLCTVCGAVAPVHPGNGTPLPSIIHGYQTVVRQHPAARHDRPA